MSMQPLDSTAANASSPGTIYLLRHGAIESQAGGKRYVGQKDVALSEVGLQQAQGWADYFAAIDLEEIICSDLTRCLETARMIGDRCALTPRPMTELREISMGSWEGLCFDVIKTGSPQAFKARGERIADHRPPGGESFRDLQHRVWPVFEDAARQVRGKALIVTHAGVIRVLVCRLLGMPLDNLFRVRLAYGALNIIEIQQESFYIQALNLNKSAMSARGE